MGASGCAGSQGRRKPRWLGPSRLSAAHLRKGGNWICLGGAPAPPAPTAGPRGPKARFALCGVWFSTAGEWARAGRAVHGGGARAIKGVPQAAAATRSFAVPGTPRPYYPASHGPRGPGRARVGMQPGKCRATWLFWESVRAREGLMWTPPTPTPWICWAQCLAQDLPCPGPGEPRPNLAASTGIPRPRDSPANSPGVRVLPPPGAATSRGGTRPAQESDLWMSSYPHPLLGLGSAATRLGTIEPLPQSPLPTPLLRTEQGANGPQS